MSIEDRMRETGLDEDDRDEVRRLARGFEDALADERDAMSRASMYAEELRAYGIDVDADL